MTHYYYRGGSWRDTASDLRAWYRFWYIPSYRIYYLGFRVVRRYK